jgi:hypothetical protein
MTRENIKNKIDIMPDRAFDVFVSMFTAFFEYVNDDDHFYSEKNMAHISKSIAEYETGEPLVTKTMEELEAYEN